MSRGWWQREIQGLLKRGPDLSIAAWLDQPKAKLLRQSWSWESCYPFIPLQHIGCRERASLAWTMECTTAGAEAIHLLTRPGMWADTQPSLSVLPCLVLSPHVINRFYCFPPLAVWNLLYTENYNYSLLFYFCSSLTNKWHFFQTNKSFTVHLSFYNEHTSFKLTEKLKTVW